MTYIIATLAFTILAVYMAENRGRSITLAVVGGLLFGGFSCLYYLIAGDSKALRKQKALDEFESVAFRAASSTPTGPTSPSNLPKRGRGRLKKQ